MKASPQEEMYRESEEHTHMFSPRFQEELQVTVLISGGASSRCSECVSSRLCSLIVEAQLVALRRSVEHVM